jgi:hypothetical protein
VEQILQPQDQLLLQPLAQKHLFLHSIMKVSTRPVGTKVSWIDQVDASKEVEEDSLQLLQGEDLEFSSIDEVVGQPL